MKRESIVAELMNYIVSGYVYFVAATLVFYMVSSLVAGVYSVVINLLDISSSVKTMFSAPEIGHLEVELLHTIAFTIVLVKAYKILISYAQRRHVSIKYLVEIAIIAPTIEIVFNTHKYSIGSLSFFAIFAFVNLLAYLHFYTTIKHVSNDYDHDACEPLLPEKIAQTVKVAKVALKSSKPKKKAS